jgi:hypothetical protein
LGELSTKNEQKFQLGNLSFFCKFHFPVGFVLMIGSPFWGNEVQSFYVRPEVGGFDGNHQYYLNRRVIVTCNVYTACSRPGFHCHRHLNRNKLISWSICKL